MLLRFLFICCPNIRTHLKLDFVDTQGLLQSPYSKRGACSWSLHDVSAYTEVTHKETECELSRHLWSIVIICAPCICTRFAPAWQSLPLSCRTTLFAPAVCPFSSLFPKRSMMLSALTASAAPHQERFTKHRPWDRNPELYSGHWEKKRVKKGPWKILIFLCYYPNWD